MIATLEAGSEARRKMEGVPKLVRSSSTLTMCRCWPTHSIKPGSANFAAEGMEYNAVKYAADIHQENAIYLMVRRLRD